MTPEKEMPLVDGKTTIIEKAKGEPERESWGKKVDFLLSVIGFAVDLGNVWRFPYICYKNGGGAFLIPYLVMLLFGGLPLFYMELALGQYQRCGCLTVWKRICPCFKGIGMAICVIAACVSWYYNTIIAWAVYFLFSSFRSQVPWVTCNNTWNTDKCTTFQDRVMECSNKTSLFSNETDNATTSGFVVTTASSECIRDRGSEDDWLTAASTEFFEREVLELQYSDGMSRLGGIKWSIALSLMAVYVLVYFALWKGIKSSGKAVWITATLPYVVLLILLIRGVTLPGASMGIKYYLSPNFSKLSDIGVWIDAASQIFFSLGPGFGVLLALSSYNKFNNNCYRDALITSAVNCLTSFLAGFAVFAVLGFMAYKQNRDISTVARIDVGLIFVVYPEALAQIGGSSFWSILFFFMLITLGLDTTFGGLEAIITGILDEYPVLRKRREFFVAGLICFCFVGGLVTTTYGGIYVVQLFDTYGAPISILLVVFFEAAAVSWIYGVKRFSQDIECMLGSPPGPFWQITWTFISPVFLLILFIMTLISAPPPAYGKYNFPIWSMTLGWLIVCSSLICILGYFIYYIFQTRGSFQDRVKQMIYPSEKPKHLTEGNPVYL
ncbi:sodium-dependent serotonin transporter-like [Gigantopelta aegis]|uniref:sodium-dependent serotonin transporter-like n=1 Tax=Gigantopelta aegis TaxID=1735272 RepID=UPI001B88D495|nr:sodium-dependent serotonin transporter-like [Gigantopelta aegis]